MKLSIIIPVYNVEGWLRRCVESIQAQTIENLEIILIDDGSTDASAAICDELASGDGRIRVIHKENGGQGLARQLVYEGLDSLNEFGYAAVVTLGDPAFYGRLGFEQAAHYDLRCRWPGTESAFQVHRLADDALNGVNGLVEYHDHFNRF